MARGGALAHYAEQIELKAWLQLKGLRARLRPSSEPARVTLVAGVQRSGTNMLMDVLEWSLLTDVYHERDARAFDNYVMRDIDTIARLHAASRAPHFVIKSLCELQRLPALQARFPGSKIVWISRHYNDVVNSMLVSFRNHAKQAQRLALDKASDGWRGEGMSDATQAVLRRHVHPDMHDATGAALMWCLRNVLFFEQGLDTNEDTLLGGYEDLVQHPEAEFRRIFEFMGLPYAPWHSRKVVATSVSKRPPPSIDSGVRKECERLLDRFQATLGLQRQREAA